MNKRDRLNWEDRNQIYPASQDSFLKCNRCGALTRDVKELIAHKKEHPKLTIWAEKREGLKKRSEKA